MDIAKITAIGQQLYGEAPEVRHLRTSINTVYALNFPSKADKIFKYCNNPQWKTGIVREQQVISSLHARGISVPKIEHTQDSVETDLEGNFSIMVRDTETSLSDLYASNPTEYGALFSDAGRWLAKLHTVSTSLIDGILRPNEAMIAEIAERRTIEENLIKADLLQAGYRHVFQRFEEMQKQSRPDLIHGDFHAGQVMVDINKIVYVLDWDGAQYGRAMRDLGIAIAYTKFFNKAIEEATLLQTAYEEIRPLTDMQRHECLHWELYTLWRVTSEAVLSEDVRNGQWGNQLIQNIYLKVV